MADVTSEARARAMEAVDSLMPTQPDELAAETTDETQQIEAETDTPETGEAEAKSAPEEDSKVSKALARIARAESRLRAEKEAVDSEKKQLQEKYKKYQSYEEEAVDLVSDTIAYLEKKGISEADQDVIVKQILKKRLGDKAPGSWNAELEARKASRETEKLRAERDREKTKQSEEENERAKTAQIQAIDNNFKEAIAKYVPPSNLSRVKAFLEDSPESAKEAIRLLGYQIAQDNPDLEEITLPQIAEVLEKSLENFSKYSPQEPRTNERDQVTTLSSSDVSQRSTKKQSGWNYDRSKKRVYQIVDEYFRND